MNDTIMKQAEEMVQAAKEARVPESVQAFTEDALNQSRDVYTKATAFAKDAGKAAEEVTAVYVKGATEIGEKFAANFAANTEAAFDAAGAVVRAGNLADAARLQADFLQQQVAKAGEQAKEFYEVSTKVAKETAETVGAITTKTIDQAKSVA